jgi:hypothetical protein
MQISTVTSRFSLDLLLARSDLVALVTLYLGPTMTSVSTSSNSTLEQGVLYPPSAVDIFQNSKVAASLLHSHKEIEGTTTRSCWCICRVNVVVEYFTRSSNVLENKDTDHDNIRHSSQVEGFPLRS